MNQETFSQLNSWLTNESTSVRKTTTQSEPIQHTKFLTDYNPHPKQLAFHKDQSRYRLFLGGNRSGKSYAGIRETVWYALQSHPYRHTPPPPLTIRVVGVDFPNGVQKILLPVYQQILLPNALQHQSFDRAYHKGPRTLHFNNGSVIEFMSSDQALDKFAGTSRSLIYFDEEPPLSIWNECRARLVDCDGDAIMTMTPIKGMTWVYDLLYVSGKVQSGEYPLSEVRDPELLETNIPIGIHDVSSHDNPFLPPHALESFAKGLSQYEQEVRISGRFAKQEGLVYPEYTEELNLKTPPETEPLNLARLFLIAKYSETSSKGPSDTSATNLKEQGGVALLKTRTIEPRQLIKDMQVAVSMDHGLKNPSCWLWHLISPDGHIVTFNELYETGRTVDEMTELIRIENQRLKLQPIYYVGDPSTKGRNALTGTSIHEEYAKRQIPLIPANNDVKAGITRVKNYMVSGKWHVTENCRNLIWELKRYSWKNYSAQKIQDVRNPPDDPMKKDDHACDALRYFMMSRPEIYATNGLPPNVTDALPTITQINPMTGLPVTGYGRTPDETWRIIEHNNRLRNTRWKQQGEVSW